MAIPGLQNVNIGIQNESANSDSLYTAFNKIKTNFALLSACASPYNTFTGNGVDVTANSISGVIGITNLGVTSLTAGTGIVLNQSNGAVVISSTGGNGNGGGTVTSIGATSTTLTISNSPIVSAGNLVVDLPVIANVAGIYTYPSVTIDNYGRITEISSAASVGTVTSVAMVPGAGIQVTGSPVTTSGTINITNTGVTRLSAGSGISLSGSNGNVTVSSTITTNPGTVTSIGLTSTTLAVSPTPVSTSGSLSVDLPNNITLSGNFSANLLTGTLVTTAQPNVTSVGTLSSLTANGNVTLGAVANVHISGGANSQFLQTDGAGNLAWATAPVAISTNIANASGTVTLDCTNHMFKITQTGIMTFAFSNVPTTAVITIIVVRTGAFAETWPGNVVWQDSIIPAASTTNGVMDIYTLMTVDSGAPWIGAPFAMGV